MSSLQFDDQGWPILMATQVAVQPPKSGVSLKSDTKAGNPWRDPANGQFSNAPIGINVIAGKDTVMPILLNISRRIIQAQIEQLEPNALAAYMNGSDATIVLMRGSERLAAFVVPTESSELDEEGLRALEQQVGISTDAANDPSLGVSQQLPQGVTEEQWERRKAIVREAARDMNITSTDWDAEDFLEGRVEDMSSINIDAFKADVRAQRLDDLVDIVDAQIRAKAEGRMKARKGVRLVAPVGYLRNALGTLDDTELAKMLTRLESRGWDKEDIKKQIVNKINDPERRAKVEQVFGESEDEESTSKENEEQ